MEWVKLGEIASLITKGTTPTTLGFDFVDEGINFIKIESISEEGSFISNKFNHITSECDNKLSRSRLQKNDLLFSIAGAIGRTAIVTDDILPANTNQALALIRIPEGVINYSYLKYVLQSSVVSDQFEKRKQGVAQLNISLKDVANFNIPLPSQAAQQMIVEILGCVEVIISLRKQQLAKLDELVKARFVEMFGDGKYPTVKASDVCGFITKGTTPPTGEIYEEYESGRVPYLKVYNLSFTGELLFDSAPQYISGETHNKQLARSKVFPDDVLMNIVGPPLGKFSLVTNTFDEWNINQAIAIFRAKEKVLPRYLMAALMQPKVLRPFLEQAVGIRQLNLSLEQCRNLEFPLPPLEEQKEFVAFAEQTDKSKLAVQQSIDQMETLKKSLMQQYFG